MSVDNDEQKRLERRLSTLSAAIMLLHLIAFGFLFDFIIRTKWEIHELLYYPVLVVGTLALVIVFYKFVTETLAKPLIKNFDQRQFKQVEKYLDGIVAGTNKHRGRSFVFSDPENRFLSFKNWEVGAGICYEYWLPKQLGEFIASNLIDENMIIPSRLKNRFETAVSKEFGIGRINWAEASPSVRFSKGNPEGDESSWHDQAKKTRRDAEAERIFTKLNRERRQSLDKEKKAIQDINNAKSIGNSLVQHIRNTALQTIQDQVAKGVDPPIIERTRFNCLSPSDLSTLNIRSLFYSHVPIANKHERSEWFLDQLNHYWLKHCVTNARGFKELCDYLDSNRTAVTIVAGYPIELKIGDHKRNSDIVEFEEKHSSNFTADPT